MHIRASGGDELQTLIEGVEAGMVERWPLEGVVISVERGDL